MYRNYLKAVLDFIITLSLLLVLFPVIMVVGLLLFLQIKGNPFFFQERPGKNEKRIKIVKFKSMTDEKDKLGNLLPDNERITKFGGFIRKTSLDELPQLFNVLIG